MTPGENLFVERQKTVKRQSKDSQETERAANRFLTEVILQQLRIVSVTSPKVGLPRFVHFMPKQRAVFLNRCTKNQLSITSLHPYSVKNSKETEK